MEDQSSDPDFYGSDNEMDVSSDAASPPTHMPTNGLKRKLSESAPDAPFKKINFGKYWDGAGTAFPDRERALQSAWFNIFLYLPPSSLLTLVKLPTFRHYLTSVAPTPSGNKKPKSTKVEHMGSDDIWAHARKVFCSNMPRPFQYMSERQLLQLLDSKECARCHKQGTPTHGAVDTFHAGPGSNGVRVIWPFKAALCGDCLLTGTISQAAALQKYPRFAKSLPGAYVSQPGPHYVLSIDMDAMIKSRGVPRSLTIQVYHTLKDIHDFQRQEQDIMQRLGNAAHDAWLDGHDERKDAAKRDYERLEKWERDHVGLGGDLSLKLREYGGSPPAKSTTTAQSKFSTHASLSNPGKHFKSLIPSMSSLQHVAASTSTRPTPDPSLGPFPAIPIQPLPPRPTQPAIDSRYQPTNRSTAIERPYVPNANHGQETEAVREQRRVGPEVVREQRRLEIERRCSRLQVPIHPAELHRMNSYHNTMMIARQMDDAQWDVLLPLLEQERGPIVNHQSQAYASWWPRTADQQRKETLENHRMTLRQKLEDYAFDIIQSDWNGGKIIKWDVPKFAVAVIRHVARCFDEDQQDTGFLPNLLPVPMEGSPAWLTLADMKWVYDQRIYPLIRNYNCDPFLCSRMKGSTKNEIVVEKDECLYVALDHQECDPKWYPFDSLMQHWTSKHGDGDRSGTDWTSPWPAEELPFVTDPEVWARHMPGYAAYNKRQQNMNAPPRDRPQSGPARPGNGDSHRPVPVAKTESKRLPPREVELKQKARIVTLGVKLNTMWDKFGGIEDFPDAIRLQIAIHHTCKDEPTTPDLDDLTLTLMQLNPQPGVHSVKDAKGLHCQLCAAQSPESAKDYNISSLAAHFKLLHPEGAYAQHEHGHSETPSWPVRMIQLPSDQEIRRYGNAVPDEMLDYYVQAFPHAMAQADPEEAVSHKVDDLANKLFNKATKKKTKPSKKKKRGSEPSQMPATDEYDPNNPMLITPAEEDEARFDTYVRDQARRMQSVPDDGASVGSPSVGRRSPSPERKNSIGALPQQEPNIQAMLAQLQRDGLIATPGLSSTQTLSSSMPHAQRLHSSGGHGHDDEGRYRSSYPRSHGPPVQEQMGRSTAIPNLQELFANATANTPPQLSAQMGPERGYAYPQQATPPQQYPYHQIEGFHVAVPQQAQTYPHVQGTYTPAPPQSASSQQYYETAPRYVIDQYGREVAIFPVHEWHSSASAPPQNTAQQTPHHTPRPGPLDPRYSHQAPPYRYM